MTLLTTLRAATVTLNAKKPEGVKKESATMAAGVFCCDDFRLEGLLHCNVTRYQRPRFRRTTNEASINKDRSVFRILFFGVITICSRYEPKTDLFTRINKAQSF
ncbi:uncharacterized protein LOC111339099 [Stylophora pistillata]|uniref:uncharacterized protein LOC111339099 n=1 Tax=Stylophora pistillata TaxID=50429 RepID=UPI000C057513|nr:uncharacterized protein LOC111339099 [Stylophora pistillata]